MKMHHFIVSACLEIFSSINHSKHYLRQPPLNLLKWSTAPSLSSCFVLLCQHSMLMETTREDSVHFKNQERLSISTLFAGQWKRCIEPPHNKGLTIFYSWWIHSYEGIVHSNIQWKKLLQVTVDFHLLYVLCSNAVANHISKFGETIVGLLGCWICGILSGQSCLVKSVNGLQLRLKTGHVNLGFIGIGLEIFYPLVFSWHLYGLLLGHSNFILLLHLQNITGLPFIM